MQFTACDPVAKWTCAQAWRRATARNAKHFLDKLQADMPFPIHAIQIDGGSELKAEFESACQRRGIELFKLPPRSPELNGHVERNNGTWRYEFNTFRPHQALGGQTPVEYLAQPTDQETPPSHMS